MSLMDRRQFIFLSSAAGLRAFGQTGVHVATIKLRPDKHLCTMPENFAGLSYEMAQIGSFSPENAGLIEQLRALAPKGILRMGGNTSDSGYWTPTSDSPMPERRPAYAFGEPKARDEPFAITLDDIKRLRGFLDATGWTCIYGINLATNVPSVAVDEAVAVVKILGPRLECLQIGNEADRYAINFRRDAKTWGPDTFLKEWLTFAEPIAARIPDVRFGVPDLAAKPDWFAGVTAGLQNSSVLSHVVTLTYHYYIDGPPSNPQMNIPNMLRSSAGVIEGARVVSAAAAAMHVTWRMTEGNTCWNGGKANVSDVFASALWSADYMLLLASMGCAGINLHGGIGKAAATGPADESTAKEKSAQPCDATGHPGPAYTPIAKICGRYVAEPVSYGMRFASHLGGAKLMAVDFDPGPVNAVAYAGVLPGGKKVVAIINKDLTQPLKIDLPGFVARLELVGPAPDARSAELREPSGPESGSLISPSTAVLLHEA